MKIAIGCDEAGVKLKDRIAAYLRQSGVEVKDFGAYDERPVLYPDKAFEVAESVARGEYERGILICGTGIGMSIAANKVAGIRAAVCHDMYSAERARGSNDAQIMTMGARVIGVELALKLVGVWMDKEFDGGNSAKKVERIKAYEQAHS
jgi:ribose 5-phosphate isomerase B